MIISLRKVRIWVLFIGLFILLTLLIAQLFHLFTTIFYTPYQVPYGNAVKVFAQDVNKEVYVTPSAMVDRLQLFYWTGE